jgi:diguanylate cyclase (GGDEF)-like protein
MRIFALVLSVALLFGSGLVLRHEQAQSHAQTIDRFDQRAEIASRFLQSYVSDTTTHEAQVARAKLASRTVSQSLFVDVATTLGFQAAVLLDGEGNLVRVFPHNRALIGTDLGAQYEHLGKAVAGNVALSNVVPSAGRSIPVIAMAVPFESKAGPRVFSGALSIAETSLGTAYLKNVSPIQGAALWLIDNTGQTIASSSDAAQSSDLLESADPALAEAVNSSDHGVYDGPLGSSRFASVQVPGTPWRLVMEAPEAQIFLAIDGLQAIVPWLVFVGLVLAVAMAMISQFKLMRARGEHLDRVELLSVTDPMTGLSNRRGYELLADQLLKAAGRDSQAALLMSFDVDGLKHINDTFGHGAGDEAIIAAAHLLRSTLRETDVIARLGGDEFCAVGVSPSGLDDGRAVLARLQDAIDLYNDREGQLFPLSISVGMAMWDPDAPTSLHDLEQTADRAMYEHKRLGRSPEALAR